MGESEPGVETTIRPGRRVGRRIGAIGILSVLVLFAVLPVGATSQERYTFVSNPLRTPTMIRHFGPGSTPPTFVLTMCLPVGWECRETPRRKVFEDNSLDLQIRPKPLNGVTPWPKEDNNNLFPGQKTTGTYRVLMAIASDTPPANIAKKDFFAPDTEVKRTQETLQRLYANIGKRISHFPHNPHMTTVFRSFHHALGPAFTMTVSLSVTGPTEGKHKLPFWRFDLTHIHMKQPHHLFIVVTAEHGDPQTGPDRLQATWDEIVRSIRVVER